jgi:putative ABC transport system substrate-binding protein
MRRREFIGLVGCAAVGWPLAVRAQQHPATIGFLRDSTAAGSDFLVRALRKGLAESGFVEGDNLTIDYAYTDGHSERLAVLAAGLVAHRVSVIVSSSINATFAAKAATSTIPIVFAVNNDPVAFGLVTSHNRPGGNLTGMSYLSSALGAKRLGLMHDILPKVTDFAVLAHSTFPSSALFVADVQEAARSLGLRIEVLHVTTESEFEPALATLSERKLGAILVAGHPVFTTHREQLVALAARYAVPTMYTLRTFAEAGGFIAYGADLPDVYRQAGVYAGRILKGEKPAALPVLQPTKFELIINMKTANALGLVIPSGIMAIADEVIE